MAKKSLSVTYARTTPESVEQGDFSETGHLETLSASPDQYDREDGKTAVDLAVKMMKDQGANEASSSFFHKGIWYSTDFATLDYGTGEEEQLSFHLKGFTEDEERDVYKAMSKRR